MTGDKRNLSASVAARLLNLSKRTGDDYHRLLVNFCFERFLYRLGVSTARDRFVLKGAMLLRLWSNEPYRATRDLDLLRQGDGSFEAIRQDIATICAAPAAPDGVGFDADAIHVERIRATHEYAGTRATLPARCGTARLTLQVDMGLGDSVWPAPQRCVYPALLDFPAPEVRAYPREAVVAEKFEAMVVLGDRNSRIKDFFDLHYLATHFEFDRATLAESIRRTFARRATPIPVDAPIALTPEYWQNPSRPRQVRAFVRRARLSVPVVPEQQFAELLGAFLLPIVQDLRRDERRDAVWRPGGPWQAAV
jgi:hypothetical protein